MKNWLFLEFFNLKMQFQKGIVGIFAKEWKNHSMNIEKAILRKNSCIINQARILTLIK